MKKYIYLTSLLLSFNFLVNAQTDKDSVLSAISKEVCIEFGKKDFTGKTENDMEMELGVMLIPAITTRIDVLKKLYGINDISGDNITLIAKEVGVKLVIECPAFMKMIVNSPTLMKEMDTKKPATATIKGKIIKIVPGDFTYFQVKDDAGKIQKIWWLENFEGADKLTEPMQDKSVAVTYIMKEMYNAQLKDYINVKIASRIE